MISARSAATISLYLTQRCWQNTCAAVTSVRNCMVARCTQCSPRRFMRSRQDLVLQLYLIRPALVRPLIMAAPCYGLVVAPAAAPVQPQLDRKQLVPEDLP